MPKQSRKKSIRNILIFIVLVNILGWVGWYIGESGDTGSSRGTGQLIWLVSPLLISILLRLFMGDGWKDMGLTLRFKNNVRWYLVALLIYPVIVFIIILAGVICGKITIPGLTGERAAQFTGLLTSAFVPTFIKNIFEEFSWRGYLAPKLLKTRLNALPVHLIVGFIWGTWHLPYYLGLLDPVQISRYTPMTMGLFIPLVIICLMAASILYDEIRTLTGSVWPSVLMHTVSNVLISTLIIENYIELSQDTQILFTPGMEGILSIILVTIAGLWVYRYRQNTCSD